MKLITPNGEEHGQINILPNSCRGDGFDSMTPEMKAKCQKQKKEDSKKVRARFVRYVDQDEPLELPYCNWSGDPIEMWKFLPTFVYEVPMGLINKVNGHQGMIERGERAEGETVTANTTTYKKLYEFIPLTF